MLIRDTTEIRKPREIFIPKMERKNDIFKYRGMQVKIRSDEHESMIIILKCVLNIHQVSSSSYLEILIEQIEGVQMVCVVGVLDQGSDLPAAAIIRKTNSTVTSEEVLDNVAERVPDAKKLRVQSIKEIRQRNCEQIVY